VSRLIDQVREFHLAFSHYVSPRPTLIPEGCDDPEALDDLRVKLIQEELDELKEALAERDLVKVADALGDLSVVVAGAALVYGIPLDECIDEIHRSNMTKLGADGKPLLNGINTPLDPTRPLGKILKGPSYEKPDLGLKSIIDRHLGS
jgi:predicted HAD superfamily Cof-like phosphohydrolase